MDGVGEVMDLTLLDVEDREDSEDKPELEELETTDDEDSEVGWGVGDGASEVGEGKGREDDWVVFGGRVG